MNPPPTGERRTAVPRPPARGEVLGKNWLSAHIPIRGGIYSAICDDAIRRLVAPTFAATKQTGLASQAFFIRYMDRAPHVRVRLQHGDGPARDQLIELIERAVAAQLALNERSAIGGAPEWVPYNPEIGRYAGVHALEVVERLFDASSEFALQQLEPSVSRDRSLRLGRGVLAMLVLAHGMLGDRESVLEFARQYSSSYLKLAAPTTGAGEQASSAFAAAQRLQASSMAPYIAASWHSLQTGQRLTRSLDAYRTAITDARKQLELLAAGGWIHLYGTPCREWMTIGPFLASSLVHMTSNRLGISIVEESFLARILQHFFETAVGH